MLKILPDALQRLSRRLVGGPIEQCVKAMQVIQELGLADQLRSVLVPMCAHPNPRVRSKAVMVLGEVPAASEVLLEKVINDNDPRVRANAIEVLESRLQEAYVPLLAERARSSHNRERANAIKALGKMKVGTAVGQLMNMMRDQRSEHRISALWALRQIGWWQLLGEVGRLAKEDDNLRVRRYALTILRNVAESVQLQKNSALASERRKVV